MNKIDSVRVSPQTLKNRTDLRILDSKYRSLVLNGKTDEALALLDKMYELAFENLHLYREAQKNEYNGNGIDLIREAVNLHIGVYLTSLEELVELSTTLRTERMNKEEQK